MMVSEIASYCGLFDKTVFSCLTDLKDLGLIESQQIKRKNPVSGQLKVSLGIRRFTAKFWDLLRVKTLVLRMLVNGQRKTLNDGF